MIEKRNGETYSIVRINLERKPHPYICPCCGRLYTAAKSKNTSITISSLPVHGHLLEIVIPRHRINCKGCSFPYEPLPECIFPGHRLTKIYAQWVYEKCKVMTYKALGTETGMSDTTIRNIEKEILTEKIAARKITTLRTLGVDEIQTGYGHNYSSIITEMDQEEVLWVGKGHKMVDLAPFFWEYRRLLSQVEWVVMDMWKGFISAFGRFCKNGKIIFDHFHVVKHLNEAINKLRILEYKRASGECREIIKGKKWLLLRRHTRLSSIQKTSLNSLLKMNRRLLKAYLLKEEFLEIWSYKKWGWAMRFWTSWKRKLRWQRLEPLKDFARMFDAHKEGIMNYFHRKDTIKMGYVEGLNNKIKTLIRQHYGYRDKEYLRMKIIQTGSKSLKHYVPYPWVATN